MYSGITNNYCRKTAKHVFTKPLQTFIFQQDGSPAHFHREVRQQCQRFTRTWARACVWKWPTTDAMAPEVPWHYALWFFSLGICQRPGIRPTIATWPLWPKDTDHCSSEEYRCTHVGACVARTWISYRCVPCHPWCTHRTSLVLKKKKTFFQFSSSCEQFHYGRSFGFLVIIVCNHKEHYKTPCISTLLDSSSWYVRSARFNKKKLGISFTYCIFVCYAWFLQ
jgi:hypothetical protein